MTNFLKDNLIKTPINLTTYYRGPALSEGKKPAFFYFALSAFDSLFLDPVNQPVAFLDGSSIRCYSFTIPYHETGADHTQSMQNLMDALQKDTGFMQDFITNCLATINYLIDEGLVDPEKMAVGGLSRGGFLATHLAAKDKRLKHILAFAPITKLTSLPEMAHLKNFSLEALLDQLIDKNVRFYIGNRDERVSTRYCFDFIEALTEKMFLAGKRSPPVELIIGPSIGYKGHGTLPHTFQSGADWLRANLTC